MRNFKNVTVTEENKEELYLKAQDLFNNGKPNYLYSKDRVFSTMIDSAEDTSPLWKKIHYLSFGFNGSQYIESTKIVAPYEEMPKYRMYQIVHYGITKEAVEAITARF